MHDENYPKCPWCKEEWHGLPIGRCKGSHITPLIVCRECGLTTPHHHYGAMSLVTELGPPQ